MARVVMRVLPSRWTTTLGGGAAPFSPSSALSAHHHSAAVTAGAAGEAQQRGRDSRNGNPSLGSTASSSSDFEDGSSDSSLSLKPRGYHVLKAERERRQLCKNRLFKAATVLAVMILLCCLLVWHQFTRHILARLPFLALTASIINTSSPVPSEVDKANCDPGNKFPLYLDSFGNLVRQTDEVRRAILDNPRDLGRWENDHKLEAEEHEQIMVGLEIVKDMLEKAGIAYFAVGQTALGSYLFHGSSPWARAIDLSIDLGEAHRVQDGVKAFNEEPLPPTIYERQFVKFFQDAVKPPKLHFHMSEKVGFLWFSNPSGGNGIFDQSIRRPHVRIHWYVESLEHGPPGESNRGETEEDRLPYAYITFDELRSDGRSMKKVRMEKSLLFPAALRPFGLLNLPFPRSLLWYLNERFNTVEPYCPGSLATNILPEVEESDSCAEMYKVYYHLERQVITSNCVKEVLYYASEPAGVVYSQGSFVPAPWAKIWGETIRGRKEHLIGHDLNYD